MSPFTPSSFLSSQNGTRRPGTDLILPPQRWLQSVLTSDAPSSPWASDMEFNSRGQQYTYHLTLWEDIGKYSGPLELHVNLCKRQDPESTKLALYSLWWYENLLGDPWWSYLCAYVCACVYLIKNSFLYIVMKCTAYEINGLVLIHGFSHFSVFYFTQEPWPNFMLGTHRWDLFLRLIKHCQVRISCCH